MTTLSLFLLRPYGRAAAITVLALLTAVIAGRRLAAHPDQAALAVFTVLMAAMLTVAAVAVSWRRLRISRADRLAALASLPPAQVARGKRLHADLRPAAYGRTAVSAAVMVGLGLTPAGATIITWAGQRLGGSWTAQVLAGALTIFGVTELLTLPFHAWKHTVMRRYGLSTQTWRAWTADVVKTFLLGAVIASIVLLAVFGAGHYAPDWWWAWAAGIITTVLLGLVFAAPLVIMPIFYKVTPLPDGPLRERLLALAARDDVRVRDVVVADASKRGRQVNAAVAGLGVTRRIILFDTLLTPPDRPAGHESTPATAAQASAIMSDTLLRGATDEQIAVIVAHELAHAKHHDLLTTSTLLGVLRLAALICALPLLNDWTWLLNQSGVTAITDPRAVAVFLIAATTFSMLLGPLGSVISRQVEARADWHALHLSDDPDAFDAAWRHVVEVNIADVNPGRIRYLLTASHPCIVERIAAGRLYARAARVRQPVTVT